LTELAGRAELAELTGLHSSVSGTPPAPGIAESRRARERPPQSNVRPRELTHAEIQAIAAALL